MERGVGTYQLKRETFSEKLILRVLIDGAWHRYQEIQQKTGLSTATLSKHLKRLEGSRIIERRMNGREYPPPVFYRLNPIITQYAHNLKEDKIEEFLDEVLEFNQVAPYHAILFRLAFKRGLTTEQLFEGLRDFKLFESKEKMLEYINSLGKAMLVKRNINEGWELTFPAVLAVARYTPNDDLDEIAKAYRDTWIIFQEWEDLTADEEVKKMICLAIKGGVTEPFEKIGLSLAFPKRFIHFITFDFPPEIRAAILFNPILMKEITLEALFLKDVINFGLFNEEWESYAQKWKSDKSSSWLIKLWKACVRNPNIRKFIEKCFIEEEEKLARLREFKKWLLEELPKL